MEELLKSLFTSPEVITGIIKQYRPVIYAVCGELFQIYKDWVDNDDYFKYSADFDHKRMSALQEAGFSRKEAFAILLNSKEKFDNAMKNSSATLTTKTK